MSPYRRSEDDVVVGLKFRPSNDVLIGCLARKLSATSLPIDNKYVFDCDLYGYEEPWQIWARYRPEGAYPGFRYFGDNKEEDLYFFTPLKKKSPTAQRFMRSIGSNGGYWKGEASGKVSTTPDGEVSWTMGRFCYEKEEKRKRINRNRSQPNNNHGGGGGEGDDQAVWIMHEYSLTQAVPSLGIDAASFNRYALCRIRKKENAKSKKRRREDEQEEPPVVFVVEIDENELSGEEFVESEWSVAANTTTTAVATNSFSDHSVSTAAGQNMAIITYPSSCADHSVPAATIVTASSDHSVPGAAAIVSTASSDHSVSAAAVAEGSLAGRANWDDKLQGFMENLYRDAPDDATWAKLMEEIDAVTASTPSVGHSVSAAAAAGDSLAMAQRWDDLKEFMGEDFKAPTAGDPKWDRYQKLMAELEAEVTTTTSSSSSDHSVSAAAAVAEESLVKEPAFPGSRWGDVTKLMDGREAAGGGVSCASSDFSGDVFLSRQSYG